MMFDEESSLGACILGAGSDWDESLTQEEFNERCDALNKVIHSGLIKKLAESFKGTLEMRNARIFNLYRGGRF